MPLNDWDTILLRETYRDQTITVSTHEGKIKADIWPITRLKDGCSLPYEAEGNTPEIAFENAKKQIDFNLSHPEKA